jgi:hypothetical protein
MIKAKNICNLYRRLELMRRGMRRMSLRMRRGWRVWRRRPWLAFIPTKTSKFLQTRKQL